MDIIRLVAAYAGICGLVLIHRLQVTGIAGHIFMFAMQRIVGIAVMIKGCFLPGLFAVTAFTLRSIHALVAVINTMTLAALRGS